MATASGDRAHWLRRVVPLWLVIPLYAAVVAWVGALATATQSVGMFLPEGAIFTESGMAVDVPKPSDNLVTNMGLVLIMRIGNIDWSTAPLVGLVGAVAVVALHRTAGGSGHWPRVAAAGGLVVGGGYALAVLSPLLAMKFEEPFLRALGMMTRGDDYSAYGWAGHAAVCLPVVVAFGNLAFMRGPHLVSERDPEPESQPEPGPDPGPQDRDQTESETTSPPQIRITPQPAPEPIAAPPAPPVIAAESDPVAPAPSAPSTGNGQGPQRGDPHAAYRRPAPDSRAD